MTDTEAPLCECGAPRPRDFRGKSVRWLQRCRVCQRERLKNLAKARSIADRPVMSAIHPGWTDDRIETMRQLWSDGQSAAQIARRLGGVTRNAVISKLHRSGLSGRAARKTAPYKPRKAKPKPWQKQVQVASAKQQSVASLFKPEPFVAAEENDIPVSERKSIHDLTAESCRWPIGDPRTPEFHFCNKLHMPGLPYCEAHARRAYQPPQPRRPAGTPSRTPTFAQGGDLAGEAANGHTAANARHKQSEKV